MFVLLAVVYLFVCCRSPLAPPRGGPLRVPRFARCARRARCCGPHIFSFFRPRAGTYYMKSGKEPQDLYGALGVPDDADDATFKRAYLDNR